MSFGSRVGETVFAGGQPSLEEFRALPSAGFKRIIDLRPAGEERGYNESTAATAGGLEYLNLPVATEQDLTPANVRQFDSWLSDPRRPVTLVHCGSGNRVGALYALRAAWLQGKDVEAALAEGRAAGLKGLERAVRAAIANAPAPQGKERP